MLPRVYLETTFVSYLTARPSRDVVIAGHQQSTHEWWESCRVDYEFCASELVFQEAGGGDPQAAQERLEVLKTVILLETRPEALALAEALVHAGDDIAGLGAVVILVDGDRRAAGRDIGLARAARGELVAVLAPLGVQTCAAARAALARARRPAACSRQRL